MAPLTKLRVLNLSDIVDLSFENIMDVLGAMKLSSRLRLNALSLNNISFGAHAIIAAEFISQTFPHLEYSIKRSFRIPLFPFLNIEILSKLKRLNELHLTKILPGNFDVFGVGNYDSIEEIFYHSNYLTIEMEPISFDEYSKIKPFRNTPIIAIQKDNLKLIKWQSIVFLSLRLLLLNCMSRQKKILKDTSLKADLKDDKILKKNTV